MLRRVSFPVFGHSLWIGPNTAFVLAIFGVLAIYCEFIWPGRLYPLLLGSASLCTGAYVLSRLKPSPLSLILIGAAVLLFIAEALWSSYFIAGSAGTAALAAGFCKMFEKPPWIFPRLAIPLCCVFGGVTCLLCYTGRRSREKKWSGV